MKKLLLIALVCLAGPICAKNTETPVERAKLVKKAAAAKKAHHKKVLVAKKKAQKIADKKIAEKKAVHAKAAAVKKAALAKKAAIAKAEATKVVAAKKVALAKKASIAKAAAAKKVEAAKVAAVKKAVLVKTAVVKKAPAKAAPVKKASEPSKPRAKVKAKKATVSVEKKKKTLAEGALCPKHGLEVSGDYYNQNGECYQRNYEQCMHSHGNGGLYGIGLHNVKFYGCACSSPFAVTKEGRCECPEGTSFMRPSNSEGGFGTCCPSGEVVSSTSWTCESPKIAKEMQACQDKNTATTRWGNRWVWNEKHGVCENQAVERCLSQNKWRSSQDQMVWNEKLEVCEGSAMRGCLASGGTPKISRGFYESCDCPKGMNASSEYGCGCPEGQFLDQGGKCIY